MDDALDEGASGTANGYELHQPACFYDDEYSQGEIDQIKRFLDIHLVDYLNGKNRYFDVNVIGSPSAAGIVFKISFRGITLTKESVKQCYALKIMPYTNETQDNTNELYFAEFLSIIDNNKFAFLYCNYKNINLNSKGSIVNVPLDVWYGDVESEKAVNHDLLYTSVKQYNSTKNKIPGSFLCDIMVSRLYWGDLIAFIHNRIKPVPYLSTDSSRRCSNYDVCGRLTFIQNSIQGWKILLTEILDSIKLMRNYNIIHGDLHCGNILIDFDGRPVIHDFGKTKLYTQPTNIEQLSFNDTIDFRNIINAILMECQGNVLNFNINFYLVSVCEAINNYCTPFTKFGVEADLAFISIGHSRHGLKLTSRPERDKLFEELKQIINSEYMFDLKKKLNEIGLSDVTTYAIFKTRKGIFARNREMYPLYKIINEWWEHNPDVEVEALGGRKRIKNKQTRRKKSSKPTNTNSRKINKS